MTRWELLSFDDKVKVTYLWRLNEDEIIVNDCMKVTKQLTFEDSMNVTYL